jgi:hypothetical protein
MYVEIVHERGVTMGKDTLEINFCKTFSFFSSENHLWRFVNLFQKIGIGGSKFLKLKTIDY